MPCLMSSPCGDVPWTTTEVLAVSLCPTASTSSLGGMRQNGYGFNLFQHWLFKLTLGDPAVRPNMTNLAGKVDFSCKLVWKASLGDQRIPEVGFGRQSPEDRGVRPGPEISVQTLRGGP